MSGGRDQQMALPLPASESPPGAAFVAAASNEAARRWLGNMQGWSNLRLALWGEPGTGKTSLARMWLGHEGCLLAGAALHGLPVLRPGQRIAVDDADGCPDATALLHLLNLCAEAGQPVLLTGQQPPARWPVTLPDLASRLRATQAVGIDPPDDAMLRAVLARLLAERQLVVAEPVQEWLLRRLPRTIAALRQAAALLDRQSLAEQHAITRPLAAIALRGLLAEADEASENSVTGHAG